MNSFNNFQVTQKRNILPEKPNFFKRQKKMNTGEGSEDMLSDLDDDQTHETMAAKIPILESRMTNKLEKIIWTIYQKKEPCIAST